MEMRCYYFPCRATGAILANANRSVNWDQNGYKMKEMQDDPAFSLNDIWLYVRMKYGCNLKILVIRS